MDSFELNKIMGAVLATCLILLVSSFTASAIFAPVMPAKPGFDIAVKEEEPAGGAKEAAAPAEPIEKLLQTASVEKGAAAAKKCAACHTFETRPTRAPRGAKSRTEVRCRVRRQPPNGLGARGQPRGCLGCRTRQHANDKGRFPLRVERREDR